MRWYERAERDPMVRVSSLLLRWTDYLPPLLDDLAWDALCRWQERLYLAHLFGER